MFDLRESPAPRNRRLAVTGARGFVASRLLPRLLERGADPIAIVRPGADASALSALGIEVRTADLADPRGMSGAFDAVGTVVHLSGMSQVPAMLPTMRDAGVRRGVFVSSAGVRTRLASPSAAAKRRGESALRASEMTYVILRPSMIYGAPGDRNIVRLLRWLERVPLLPLPGAGEVLQQPVHVDDLVTAILAALGVPEGTRAEYDAGGPEAMPLRDVVRVCAEELARPAWTFPVPLRPAFHAARLARWLRVPFPVRPEQVLRLAESKAVDVAPLTRDLGVRPRAFREGIRGEIAALRAPGGAARQLMPPMLPVRVPRS